ncbi:MAG: TOBE domain-containing protein, partial [Pseudomonadota bacterium]
PPSPGNHHGHTGVHGFARGVALVRRCADLRHRVLEQGKAVAQGPLAELLSRFDLPVRLGEDVSVVLSAEITERDTQWHLVKAAFPGGTLWLRDGGEEIGQAIRIRILARDVSLTLATHDDTSILNRLPAKVIEIAADTDEAMSLVRLKIGTSVIISRLTKRSISHLHLNIGSQAWVQIKSVAIVR